MLKLHVRRESVYPTVRITRSERNFSHWARSSNRTEADEITRLSMRVGIGGLNAWAAAGEIGAHSNAIPTLLKTIAVLAEVSSAATERADDGSIHALRNLASERARLRANADRVVDLFSDSKKMAAHFHTYALSEQPGSSPTAYFFGGHAKTGPFAGVTGRDAFDLKSNLLARVDEMLVNGSLTALRGGGFNKTYIYQPTGQVVRVGTTNSEDMSATMAYSRFTGRGAGATLDPDQSLYIPTLVHRGGRRSTGTSVLVMERVPGMSLTQMALAKTMGTVPPEQLNSLLLVPDKVADVIVDMHMHRRAHGDLTPGNVMFDPATGNVRVIDFGFAVRGKDRDKRLHDVYGLGNLIVGFGSTTGEPRMTQGQKMYLRALDRYPGPDENAAIYKAHPELYAQHVARFYERKATLRQAMQR